MATQEFQYIDGQAFPVKDSGMTLVDGYYIPDENLEEYLRDREAMAEKATAIFEKHCHSVRRDFKGSQDGEALIGCDDKGDIIMFIHLDPFNVEAMVDADASGTLEALLLEEDDVDEDDEYDEYDEVDEDDDQ